MPLPPEAGYMKEAVQQAARELMQCCAGGREHTCGSMRRPEQCPTAPAAEGAAQHLVHLGEEGAAGGAEDSCSRRSILVSRAQRRS